jgi:hypothetical protein
MLKASITLSVAAVIVAGCGKPVVIPPDQRVATATSAPIPIRIVNDTEAPVTAERFEEGAGTVLRPGAEIATSVVVAITYPLDASAGLPWWTVDAARPAAELVETPRAFLRQDGDWRLRLVAGNGTTADLFLSTDDCVTPGGAGTPRFVERIDATVGALQDAFDVRQVCEPGTD